MTGKAGSGQTSGYLSRLECLNVDPATSARHAVGPRIGMKRTIQTSTLAVFILVGIAIVGRHLPEKEKWLLVERRSAEQYSRALLAGDSKKQQEYQNHFIDYVVVTDQRHKIVLFSPHENHEATFVFAPTHTESEVEYESRKAKKIAAGWYSLD
ncbi:hypothetical protein [Geomonas ferrireducens]|uniref:hypothetical protein n=1 Tax=Geomonas ferrireducens TaxID=2570227 RepID=UPI0010A79E6F|nr:hypothetical protein [Geomonas ferrireducens]